MDPLLDDSEVSQSIKDLVDQFLDQPISSLLASSSFQLDDNNKLLIDKMIPNYNDEMTLQEFFDGFTPFMKSFLHTTSGSEDIKKSTSESLNKEEYNFKNWGLHFNEKLKETQLGKTFVELLKLMLMDDQKGDFWLQFQHAYGLLEYSISRKKEPAGKEKRTHF